MFADDCLIFFLSKAKVEPVEQVRRILRKYEQASGQKVNYNKSALYFSPNCTSTCRARISGVLTIAEQHSIRRYLGIDHIISQSHSAIVKDLITWAHGKLSFWKRQTLSKAGRLV